MVLKHRRKNNEQLQYYKRLIFTLPFPFVFVLNFYRRSPFSCTAFLTTLLTLTLPTSFRSFFLIFLPIPIWYR